MMKSKISIEIDFENGNQPVIQILQENSDDVRDKLVTTFTQNSSGWLKLRWDSNPTPAETPFNRLFISQIKVEDLKAEAALMIEQQEVHEAWLKDQEIHPA